MSFSACGRPIVLTLVFRKDYLVPLITRKFAMGSINSADRAHLHLRRIDSLKDPFDAGKVFVYGEGD